MKTKSESQTTTRNNSQIRELTLDSGSFSPKDRFIKVVKEQLVKCGAVYLSPERTEKIFPLPPSEQEVLRELSKPGSLNYRTVHLGCASDGGYYSYLYADVFPLDLGLSSLERNIYERACPQAAVDFLCNISGIPNLALKRCKITSMERGHVISTHDHNHVNEFHAILSLETASDGGKYEFADRTGARRWVTMAPGSLMLVHGDIAEGINHVWAGRRRSFIYFFEQDTAPPLIS